MSPKHCLVRNHTVEAPAGADGFLRCQRCIGDYILAVEFLPSTHDVNIIEGLTHPIFVMFREVESRSTAQGMESLCVSSADAPDIFHRQPFQGGDAVLVVVDDATMTLHLKFFSQFGGALRKCLIRRQSDADRHAHRTFDATIKVLAPLLQVDVLHAV